MMVIANSHCDRLPRRSCIGNQRKVSYHFPLPIAHARNRSDPRKKTWAEKVGMRRTDPDCRRRVPIRKIKQARDCDFDGIGWKFEKMDR